MGCGASVESSSQRHAPVLPPRDENLLASLRANVPLDDLPDCVADLHHIMPSNIRNAPMRLLKITNVLTWPNVIVFEDVPKSAYLEMPYAEVHDDIWNQTAVLSWRWGASKPSSKQPGFSPMLPAQFQELREALTRASMQGLVYLWIDWCCVPQHGSNSMIEVLRSKVFYARARLMMIIPTFHPLPATGIVRLLLVKAVRSLKKRENKVPENTAAADVVKGMLDRQLVAGREYFSRVWTLAERMARHGRNEQLSNWLSLEAWLGMVVDAMIKSTEDKAASQIYKKILGKETGALLDAILSPLQDAVQTGSMMVAEGLEDMAAQLFESAASMWQAASTLDEGPTKAWLLTYLEEAPTDVYQAWSEADRVWAVYSYFCWKQVDQSSPTNLLDALQDLVRVAGGTRKHTATLAKKLGILNLLPIDPKDHALSVACENGNIEKARELLAAGANVLQASEKDGTTLLHTAVSRKDLELVKVLIEGGADVNTAKQSGAAPLILAAQNNEVEIMRVLLAAGANKEACFKDGATALYVSAEKGKVEALNLLIEAGAKLDVRLTTGFQYNPLLISILNGHLEAAGALLKAGADRNAVCEDGASVLYLAAEKNYLDVVKRLLELGVDNEACLRSGATALYIASSNGYLEIVKALIKGGSKVNAKRKDNSCPIYVASEKGHAEIVQALIDAGADADSAFQTGATPIYIAAQNNRANVINVLLKAGANKNVKLKGGYQPIHSSALAGHVEATGALIEGGMDKNATLDDGASALYLAAEKGHLELAKYLLSVGADKDKADNRGKKPKDVAKAGSGVAALL